MRSSLPLWRLSFLWLFPFLVVALFEDEAYHIDYQHALLGSPLPKNTFFHQPSPTSKASLLYTLSERNVLGALNPKDGAVVWRQQVGNSTGTGHVPGFLRVVNQTSLIYTAVGNTVSSWDASDGRLVAQWQGSGNVKSLELHNGDPLVVFDAQGVSMLARLNSANAKMMWEVRDASGDLPLGLTTSSQHVYYLTLVPKLLKGYQIKITQVDPFSAKPGQQILLDSQDEVASVDSILHIGSNAENPVVAWTDRSFKTLKLNILGQKATTTINIAKHGDTALERISIHAPAGSKTLSHLLVAYHAQDIHWAEVYHISKDKKSFQKAYDLPKLGGSGAFAISEVAGKIYFVRHSETEVTLLSSESHGILERWPVKLSANSLPSALSAVQEAIVEVAPKGSNKYAVRSMLVLGSGDTILVRNGEQDWTRSESLAGIVAAAWTDLPQTLNLAKTLESEIHANFISAYIHRVTRHIKDLEHLPGWLQAIPQRVLSSFGLGITSAPEQFAADPFGFRKLVIVATQRGRIAALDSGSHGQVLWNIQGAKIEADNVWNVKQILILGDLAWIMMDDASKSVFVTLAGEIKSDWPLDDVAQGSRVLPLASSSRSSLISISQNGVPDFKAYKGDKPVTLVTQELDGTLAGWASSNDQPLKTWEFSPLEGYEVTSVAIRPAHDPVASIGRALGDRSVLYKYLSTNLALVTSSNSKVSTVSVVLLDTVNGQILHSAEHKDVDTTAGVAATFAENWFAYLLQSDPVLAEIGSTGGSKSVQLNIVELYESSIPNDRGPLGTTGNASALRGINYSPYTESATYILPSTLTSLTTTTTKQGITPRSILAYAPSLSAIVAIPIAMLAPRRPVGREPTAAEREEGLFRYLPFLDTNPAWTISHRRELLGIKGIVSTPSDLESTSLVFAYGDLDVFGTRVAPIGAFDMLGKGFNKIQLVLTVVALAIGTGILAPMVRKKQIDGLWRT